MKKLKFLFSAAVFLVSLLPFSVFSQQYYKLDQNNSFLVIRGTSSLHDWKLQFTGMKCDASLKIRNNTLTEINRVEFQAPVEGIEGEKRKMEKKAEKALKGEKYPDIRFTINSIDRLNVSDGGNMQLPGELTIKGRQKEVKIPVVFNFRSENRFTVKGEFSLDMTNFGIKPPKALLGAIKTDEMVNIQFSLAFTHSDEFRRKYY